jgi:hypothetical protein
MHWHVEPSTSAGAPATIVSGARGIHGAGMLGTHGIGVRTPSAAAVAAATVGFARDVHIPNGGIFTNGTWSMTFAIGRPSTTIRPVGNTLSAPGAMPNVQVRAAPVHAFKAMVVPLYCFEPLTEDVSLLPVVVTKQVTARSASCSQLRAEGSR